MGKAKHAKSKITSIQYIHDPEAAKQWMELFMEIAKKNYMDQVMHKDKLN